MFEHSSCVRFNTNCHYCLTSLNRDTPAKVVPVTTLLVPSAESATESESSAFHRLRLCVMETKPASEIEENVIT